MWGYAVLALASMLGLAPQAFASEEASEIGVGRLLAETLTIATLWH